MLDPVLLSRLQFAFVMAFHFLLPAFTIGLASYIAVLEGLHLATGKPVYVRISMFWVKIFAIAFGMGVVSGIVLPFQFGTNWSRYSDATGNIVAPLMAYEGLTAFFLEAAFLGVLLFGRKLVPPWAYFAAAALVALGTLFSSFWILAANSWMHTPVGYMIVDGRFVPTDWLAVIFSPSFPYRFAHTVTAVYLTTAFTVIGVAAWYLRNNRFVEESRVMITMGVLLAWILRGRDGAPPAAAGTRLGVAGLRARCPRCADGGRDRLHRSGHGPLHILSAADRQCVLLHRCRTCRGRLLDLVRTDDHRDGRLEARQSRPAGAARHVRDGRQCGFVAVDHCRRRR
jgi:hypothetical protein